LKNVPGLVILSSGRDHGKFHFSGLRDRFAEEPSQVLLRAKLDPAKASLDFKPFVSEDKPVLTRRLLSVLDAPPGVGLDWSGNTVHLTGVAPIAWIRSTHRHLNFLDGWIDLDFSRVRDTEGLEAERILNRLGPFRVSYSLGSAELTPDQVRALLPVARDLQKVGQLARRTGRRWHLLAEGFADLKGSRELNLLLSRKRSALLTDWLRAQGIPRVRIDFVGRGKNPAEGRSSRLVADFPEKRGAVAQGDATR
jgi:hypothetical protein